MKIGIIILNYNGVADTLSCLESLKRLNTKGVELETIVVDNASTDDSVIKIKQAHPRVHVLVNSENLGFAEGNNIGIRYGLKRGVDFLLILNSDTRVDSSCLEQLLKAAAKETRGGIYSPKIYFTSGHETHKERYVKRDLGHIIWYAGGQIDWHNVLASHRGVDEVDTGQYNELVKTSFVSGCAMFVRRDVFEKAGLFDQKFYLYYEDVDLCMRARMKGFELYYVPSAVVWHKNASSTHGTGSDLQSYYLTRNRMLVGTRYAPWKTRLALMREAMVFLMRGTRTQKQAIGDFLRKKYGPRGKTHEWTLPKINLMKFFRQTNSKKQNL